MNLIELKEDLFKAPQSAMLTHCISADFALGAGIAVEFQRRYQLREELRRRYPAQQPASVGSCVQVGRVYNLITKAKYWHKPLYASLRAALIDMRQQAVYNGVKEIAMPRIGCGIDGLDWGTVRAMLERVFAQTDITLTVYVWKP